MFLYKNSLNAFWKICTDGIEKHTPSKKRYLPANHLSLNMIYRKQSWKEQDMLLIGKKEVIKMFSYFVNNTEWKLSKYGVFSGPYFSVFSPNTEKRGPEKTPYLETFHAVKEITEYHRYVKQKKAEAATGGVL